VRWKDLTSPSGSWQGLDFLVDPADLVARAPVLRVRAGQRRIAIACDAEPVLWAHVHRLHYGLWLLHAARRESWSVVPPILSRVITRFGDATNRDAWWRAWARWFAEQLCASERTPLSPGRWCFVVADAAGLRATQRAWTPTSWSRFGVLRDVRTCLDSPPLRWESWWTTGSSAVLRARSVAPEAARVHAFRKRVSGRTLPPVLVGYVSGLDMHVVLDGHDRLRAALLEQTTPPIIVLWRVRAHEGFSDQVRQAGVLREIEWRRLRGVELPVDVENDLVLGAFDDRELLAATTQAWPLVGGPRRWDEQVLAEGIAATHPIFAGEPPATTSTGRGR
jgi:hypothetical protein